MQETFKEIIYKAYLNVINNKVLEIQKLLTDLINIAGNETKSSAGDKHETALAMIQIEQTNKKIHLNTLLEQQTILQNLRLDIDTSKIMNGSLVKTNNGYLFISVALGKIIVNEETIIALSIQSPLAQKIMGAKAGSVIAFNNVTYSIHGII